MAVWGSFLPQINNTIRNVTGNDTPADSAVKARIVSGITAQKPATRQQMLFYSEQLIR